MGTKNLKKGRQKNSSSENKSSDEDKDVERKKRLRQRSQPRRKGVSAFSTIIGVGILSISLGILWSQTNNDEMINEDLFSFMTSFVCRAPGGGYCHKALVPVRRTQIAKRFIASKEVVLVVPRHLQIWDLDALRDPFVQTQLSRARHGTTGNPLDSGAHLAAYLARRHVLAKRNRNDTHFDEEEDAMLDYFNILPSYQDMSTFHPVTWTEEELGDSLGGRQSSSFLVAKAHRDMVVSEYKAFASVSPDFRHDVSLEEFMRMRIHVMSRGFGPGPPGPEEHLLESNFATIQDEVSFVHEKFGVNLSVGCRAMVPILDMYNHHAKPNVEWRYKSDERAFVIYAASQGIAPGNEIIDSYGKYTDSHLFAKFGFVNGDGSGHTQASIAVLHRMLDVGMQNQFSYLPLNVKHEAEHTIGRHEQEMIVRYLQFDDGHAECIQEHLHADAFELKRLKFQVLLHISDMPDRWTLSMPPRDPQIQPAVSSNIPNTFNVPKFDHRNLRFDASKLISTCRLIVLRKDDFNGNAKTVLEEVLGNGTAKSFSVGRQSDALEFRALECLARLSGIALSRFNKAVSEETKMVSKLTQDAFQSRNWTTAHVRLGEMQTLELLRGISLSGMRQLGQNVPKDDLQQRKHPCRSELSKPLFQPAF